MQKNIQSAKNIGTGLVAYKKKLTFLYREYKDAIVSLQKAQLALQNPQDPFVFSKPPQACPQLEACAFWLFDTEYACRSINELIASVGGQQKQSERHESAVWASREKLCSLRVTRIFPQPRSTWDLQKYKSTGRLYWVNATTAEQGNSNRSRVDDICNAMHVSIQKMFLFQ